MHSIHMPVKKPGLIFFWQQLIQLNKEEQD